MLYILAPQSLQREREREREREIKGESKIKFKKSISFNWKLVVIWLVRDGKSEFILQKNIF